MKSTLKRMLAATISVSILFSLVACNTKKDEPVKPDATQAPKETVTFKMFRNLSAPEYPSDGGPAKPYILDFVSKQGVTGVDYQVELANGPDYETKLNLLIAAGTPPDFFDATIAQINKFSADGTIRQLDDLYKIMPNAQRYWKQTDLDVSKVGGKLYAFPNGYRPEPVNQPQASGFIIRKDWLDNLGLKEPQTVDDFYNVIKAFTQKDPDKNGKNDTYGLASIKGTGYAPYFEGIFGAYGIMPGFWFERDGKLKFGTTLPEMKEALTTLNKWYKEGLIDPEFMIIERKQLDEKIVNSKVGITATAVWDINPAQVLNQSLKKITPTAKSVFLAPPKGPSGKQGWAEIAPGTAVHAISAKCSKPELLAKFLDALLAKTKEDGPVIVSGFEGKSWTFDKNTNTVNFIVTSNEQWRDGFAHPVQFISNIDRRWVTDEDMKKGLTIANQYVVKNSFWKNVPANNDYPDLPKMWNEYFIKIVTGDLPISAWDEYVTKFYKQGGTEIEKQVNDEWKKNK